MKIHAQIPYEHLIANLVLEYEIASCETLSSNEKQALILNMTPDIKKALKKILGKNGVFGITRVNPAYEIGKYETIIITIEECSRGKLHAIFRELVQREAQGIRLELL